MSYSNEVRVRFFDFLAHTSDQAEISKARTREEDTTLVDYESFRDTPLIQFQAEYLVVGRKGNLRQTLMNKWGIKRLEEIEEVFSMRAPDVGPEKMKMANEKMYSLGGGMYLSHSWRSEDATCGWGQGDWTIVKFAPIVEQVFLDWAEEMRRPLY